MSTAQEQVRCAGRSGSPTLRDCGAPPLYVTTQTSGHNPMYACGRHIGWLIRYRTVPGRSLTVTRLGGTDGT